MSTGWEKIIKIELVGDEDAAADIASRFQAILAEHGLPPLTITRKRIPGDTARTYKVRTSAVE